MGTSTEASDHPIAKLIDAFGGPTHFGRAVGVGASTASEMKRRRSIPVSYWPLIVAAAAAAGMEGITLEAIALMHLAHDAPPTVPDAPQPQRAAS